MRSPIYDYLEMKEISNPSVYSASLPKGDSIDFIHIEGGPFQMGNDPGVEIQMPDFYLGKYPVTVGQYMQFVEATNTHHPEWLEEGSIYNVHTGEEEYYQQNFLKNDHPIIGVDWNNANAFCEWLSLENGQKYRLPTEAEWEYAARGGRLSNGYEYSGSNKLKEVGWYDKNSHGETKAVGLKYPNELGLYDMSGNVDEWCADYWHGDINNIPLDRSAWIKGGDNDRRVVRGGSWNDIDDLCHILYRFKYVINDRNLFVGFRVARY